MWVATRTHTSIGMSAPQPGLSFWLLFVPRKLNFGVSESHIGLHERRLPSGPTPKPLMIDTKAATLSRNVKILVVTVSGWGVDPRDEYICQLFLVKFRIKILVIPMTSV